MYTKEFVLRKTFPREVCASRRYSQHCLVEHTRGIECDVNALTVNVSLLAHDVIVRH